VINESDILKKETVKTDTKIIFNQNLNLF